MHAAGACSLLSLCCCVPACGCAERTRTAALGRRQRQRAGRRQLARHARRVVQRWAAQRPRGLALGPPLTGPLRAPERAPAQESETLRYAVLYAPAPDACCMHVVMTQDDRVRHEAARPRLLLLQAKTCTESDNSFYRRLTCQVSAAWPESPHAAPASQLGLGRRM